MSTNTLDRFRARSTVERAVYTVAEVAELLGLALGGTYVLIREGSIPALKMGGRWVVPKRRFHAWLDGLEDDDVEPAPPEPARVPATAVPTPRPAGRGR